MVSSGSTYIITVINYDHYHHEVPSIPLGKVNRESKWVQHMGPSGELHLSNKSSEKGLGITTGSTAYTSSYNQW